MKTLKIMMAALAVAALTSCDEHRDIPDTSIRSCDILCTDGKVVRYEEMKEQDKEPIAVVFHVNHSDQMPGIGYAVYLWDVEPAAFCDSISGAKQNTSSDITTYDGNKNTYAMFASGCSPSANNVFSIWGYGQSAFIPSVAEIRLLYEAKETINRYINLCGGDVISDKPDECWYWTSTEVKGQEYTKGWLFSLASGALQETPKTQEYKIRPIISLYN